jgi:hypothetical protein
MAFARELIFHGTDVAQSPAPLGCLFDEPFSTTRRANSEIPFLSHGKIQRRQPANVAGLLLFLGVVVDRPEASIAAA